MNLLRSLPINLFVLFYALSGLVAQSTSSYDPFHNIAKFVPKPPEQPICCLKPLPSPESTEELILSFEDWKARQAQLQADEKPRESARPASTPVVSPDATPDSTIDDQTAIIATPVEQPAPPHFRVPLTGRFNYASLDCSARVHSSHRSAKSASNILSSKKDRYMLSPCETPGEEKSIVVKGFYPYIQNSGTRPYEAGQGLRGPYLEVWAKSAVFRPYVDLVSESYVAGRGRKDGKVS